MSSPADIETRIDQVSALLRGKLGARGKTLGAALRKADRRLPRHVRAEAHRLADAEAFAHHPKLRLTLETDRLDRAATEVGNHLNGIDLADRRKGWWLGMLGGLAFNILLGFVLLLVVLRWRGFI